MGGSSAPDTNLPSNLVLLCPPCHLAIESRRAEAVGAGWLVLQGSDPAETALLIHGDRWLYLTADGSYDVHPPRWREKGGAK